MNFDKFSINLINCGKRRKREKYKIRSQKAQYGTIYDDCMHNRSVPGTA